MRAHMQYVAYLNQLARIINYYNPCSNPVDLEYLPRGICLMSFSLSVALARGITFKVVVCFNAYTTIDMEKLADFYRTLLTSENAQLQFPRFSCSFY